MWKRVQWFFTVFIMIFWAGLLTPSDIAEGGHDPLMTTVTVVVQTIVIPLTVLLTLAEKKRILVGMRVALLPLAASCLLVLSTAWSVERHVTLRRSLIFFFSTLFAIYVGSCLSRARQLYLYASVSLISILGCFLIVILLPSYGISTETHAGEWKGLFQHKNILGRQMVFAMVVLLSARSFRTRLAHWGAMAGALLLLGLSRSGTSLMACGAVLLGYGCVRLARIRNRNSMPLWLAVLPLMLAAAGSGWIFHDQIFALLGKDATLTGRTTIWAFAMQGIGRRPLLGYGYGVFWRQTLIGQLLPQGLLATHAHNGFLDILLDAGIAGLGLFLILFTVQTTRVLGGVIDQRAPLSGFTVFGFLSIIAFLASNLTESNLYREHTFLWIPFVSIYTAMGLRRKSRHASENSPGTISASQMVLQGPSP